MKRNPLKIMSITLLIAVWTVSFVLGVGVDKPRPTYTIQQRIDQFGAAAESRLKPWFFKAGVSYPPSDIALVAYKDVRELVVVARSSKRKPWVPVVRYPILAASGKLGPKLREGDKQVPEGNYRAESLNPNSRFHVSIRVGYPDAFDREQGRKDGRTSLGSDIMIHGNAKSIGCLAMGDVAAEELFTLVAKVGTGHTQIVIAPCDLLTKPRPNLGPDAPKWVSKLYDQIEARLKLLANQK